MADLAVSNAVDTMMQAANAAGIRSAIGAAAATDLSSHTSDTSNPHGVTKSQVGLGNVDNTSNATERAASATLQNKTLGSGCVIPWGEIIVLSAKGTDAEANTDVGPPFVLPHSITLTHVIAVCDVAPTGSAAVIDINSGFPGSPGSSVLSTPITIDAGEYTSEDSGIPPVISTASLSSGALLTFDLDQVGSSVAGQCYTVTLIGTRTL